MLQVQVFEVQKGIIQLKKLLRQQTEANTPENKM